MFVVCLVDIQLGQVVQAEELEPSVSMSVSEIEAGVSGRHTERRRMPPFACVVLEMMLKYSVARKPRVSEHVVEGNKSKDDRPKEDV